MPLERILHLEDADDDALLIRRALERSGIQAQIVVVSDAASYKAELGRDGFDLVLSDNCIPGFGSLGALESARAHHPDIPFICVSGAWENKTVDALLAAGATCCVLKSRPQELVALVRQALALARADKEIRRLALEQKGSARLIRAVQDLSHARDVDTIRGIVRTAARELIGADGATFVLRDGDQCHYVDEDAISPLWKGQRFPMSACISGWVMQHGEPVSLPDIYADPRIPADAYRPTFVKSLLMVPIRPDLPLGAIGNYWASRHLAEPHEVEMLQALANTTAVALENVRIYEELERRVQDRTRLLEAANRELESFSFSVSHDLRSPLHSISAYAELLQDTVLPPTEQERADYLARIRGQTVRMEHLIGDFLRLAQLTRADLNPEPVDLARMAADIVATLRQSHPDRQIEVVIPDSLPALADPNLLQVALENLFSNAWKYTGRIASGARVELGCLVPGKGPPVFFVRDNGAGFDPVYASKLFVPFQRLHSPKDFPGSGVGLATVQRIVTKHGGLIWAESRPDQGATFFFTLAPGAPEPANTPAS